MLTRSTEMPTSAASLTRMRGQRMKVSLQELELQQAELLPAREALGKKCKMRHQGRNVTVNTAIAFNIAVVTIHGDNNFVVVSQHAEANAGR